MTTADKPSTPSDCSLAERLAEFAAAARNLPRSPGVYIMCAPLANPIYVGKAKNLQRRVSAYFAPSAARDRKVSRMLAALASIYYAETDSELEALLLEARLVKQWLPRFNRELREPESYCFVRIRLSDQLPLIEVTRARTDDGAWYAGPFRCPSTVREAVEAVTSVFRLRRCSAPVLPGSRKWGCVYHDLGKCAAPCAGTVPVAQYRASVEAAADSLGGISHEALARLTDSRDQLAEQFRFEGAHRVHSRIQALEQVSSGSLNVRPTLDGKFVAVAPTRFPGCPVLLLISHGKLAGKFICRPRASPTREQLMRAFKCLDSAKRDLLPGTPSSDDALIIQSFLKRRSLSDSLFVFAPDAPENLIDRVRCAVDAVRRAGVSD